MASLTNKASGFSLIEVLLSMAVLAILVVGALSANSITTNTVNLNQIRTKANFLAEEGVDALQSVRAGNFGALAGGVYHPVYDGANGWLLSSGNEQVGNYTRAITITPVERSIACTAGICDIVSAGGVVDKNSFWGEVKVTWNENGVTKDATLTTLVTNWR